MSIIRNIGFRTLSVVLSLCLLAVSLPLSAFAVGGGNAAEPEGISVNSNAEVIEVKEDRTVSEKTFRLEDGTFYIAHYDTEIHEEDESGNLIDIDNRLYARDGLISTENGRYSFPVKTSDSSSLFSLSGKNNSVSFILNDASHGIPGEISNQKTDLGKDASRLEVLATLDNIRSSVLYKDILMNADVEYVIYGRNVKENIVLKERQIQTEYIYSFILSLENLVPVTAENGQIDLNDPETGETVYFLPKPAMWDAAGEFSDAVYYELTETENGLFTLIITADPEWINDENRVFPVTIDPPVYSSSSNVLDTYVSSSSPSSSYANSPTIYVSSTQRSYWKLTTLPSLPKSAYITGAEFKATAFPNMSTQTNLDVAAYEILTDWDSTLTWNKTVASTDPAGQIADTFVDFNNLYTNYVSGGFYFA